MCAPARAFHKAFACLIKITMNSPTEWLESRAVILRRHFVAEFIYLIRLQFEWINLAAKNINFACARLRDSIRGSKLTRLSFSGRCQPSTSRQLDLNIKLALGEVDYKSRFAADAPICSASRRCSDDGASDTANDLVENANTKMKFIHLPDMTYGRDYRRSLAHQRHTSDASADAVENPN